MWSNHSTRDPLLCLLKGSIKYFVKDGPTSGCLLSLESGSRKNRSANESKVSRTMKSPLVEWEWTALPENILGVVSKSETVLTNQLRQSRVKSMKSEETQTWLKSRPRKWYRYKCTNIKPLPGLKLSLRVQHIRHFPKIDKDLGSPNEHWKLLEPVSYLKNRKQ